MIIWHGNFAALFGERTRRREQRAKMERASQKTAKQLRRKAVRTTNMSFRCSPEFAELARSTKEQLGISIADLMEQALESYVESLQGENGDEGTD